MKRTVVFLILLILTPFFSFAKKACVWDKHNWIDNPSINFFTEGEKSSLNFKWKDTIGGTSAPFVSPIFDINYTFSTKYFGVRLGYETDFNYIKNTSENTSYNYNMLSIPYITLTTSFGKGIFGAGLKIDLNSKFTTYTNINEKVRPLGFLWSFLSGRRNNLSNETNYSINTSFSLTDKNIYSVAIIIDGFISGENDLENYSFLKLNESLDLSFTIRTPKYDSLDREKPYGLLFSLDMIKIASNEKRKIDTNLDFYLIVGYKTEISIENSFNLNLYDNYNFYYKPALKIENNVFSIKINALVDKNVFLNKSKSIPFSVDLSLFF